MGIVEAGIYARISQDTDGAGDGVGRQEADCRVKADALGWTVVDVYVDNDVSATRSKSRPQYERMLADARSGRIGGLVVWNVDRLTRSVRELEDIIDLHEATGLMLANVRGEIDLGTGQGRLIARILGAAARNETDAMSVRLKRRFEEKAERGEPHGYPPYGFERRIVPGSKTGLDFVVPAEAAVVIEAAERILARESLRSVCIDFNDRGIPAPQVKLWNSTTLKQILLRPANAGLRAHRGVIKGSSASEAIFSEAIFTQLQALLSDPDRRTNVGVGPAAKHLLSGIARCGREDCTGTMKRFARRSQPQKNGGTKEQPAAYACSFCHRVRRQQAPVEEIVIARVIAVMERPDAVELIGATDPAEAQAAQQELDGLDARLAVAADSFADGDIDASQLKRITAGIREQKSTAERRLARARPSTPATGLMGAVDVGAAWAGLTMDAQRAVISELFTVTIMPLGSGRKFDPASVKVELKA